MTDFTLDDKDKRSLQNSIHSELSSLLSPGAVIALPPSQEFESVSLRFTEYGRPTYLLAVRPACEDDVVRTVNFAREKGIPFAPRSGHHCVTTSMRRLRNGIVIDMRPIKHMTFNAEQRLVAVGGGTIMDDFTRYVHGLGMEVTVGSCPTTGVIGVAFGAGLGRLQGKYGYLNDNLVSCKLLLGNGSIVTVSESSNSDLFWGLRGAGHNFGIALEATFRVYPQTNSGIHYSWDLEYRLEQCEEVFRVLNEVHTVMPPELAIFVVWKRESGGESHLILVNLVYSGPERDSMPWVAHFSNLNPVRSTKVTATWDELPWITYGAQNKLLSKPEVWKLAPNKMMSAVSVKSFELVTTRAFFESVKEMNERFAGKGWFGAMFESLPHHRTRDIEDDATAFPWRHGTNHHLMITATPKSTQDSEIFEAWLEKWKLAFIETSGYGRLQQYVNYGNTTLKADPVQALYGYEPWRLQRLRELKQRYDPDGLFSWYQPFD
ncbi:FAD binding domain-containing protein [Penicillium canescens]|nr:FAD binding domain-containing protein [Penicillium canescens]